MSSLEQIRLAYRRELDLNEDPEFIDDLADLLDIAERWLLQHISPEGF